MAYRRPLSKSSKAERGQRKPAFGTCTVRLQEFSIRSTEILWSKIKKKMNHTNTSLFKDFSVNTRYKSTLSQRGNHVGWRRDVFSTYIVEWLLGWIIQKFWRANQKCTTDDTGKLLLFDNKIVSTENIIVNVFEMEF